MPSIILWKVFKFVFTSKIRFLNSKRCLRIYLTAYFKLLLYYVVIFLPKVIISYMDYLKKKLQNQNILKAYEELDTRIASGWYVETKDDKKLKQYKTNQIKFRVSKKLKNTWRYTSSFYLNKYC